MNPLIVDLDSPMVSWYTISAMRNKYDLQKVRDVSDVDAAWTAGYIDGEGSIGVNAYQGAYRLTIQVSSSVPASLEKLHTLFGGHLGGPYKASGEGRQKVWKWTPAGRLGQEILRRILPYLTIKADEAQVALTFPYDARTPGPRGYWAPLAAFTTMRRREVRDELIRLHHLRYA